ncbi:hypothetical protein Bbad01_15760 [Bacillus badius]|nr:hypothetical protein Bbad01_15760 [Bacillus badius]
MKADDEHENFCCPPTAIVGGGKGSGALETTNLAIYEKVLPELPN